MNSNGDKYNDVINFETDKRDLETAKVIKKFLIIGAGAVVLLVIIVLIINSIINGKVDMTLMNLNVDQGTISPEFNSNVNDYSIETNADSIFFTCKAKSKKVKAIGCGSSIDLPDSENKVSITIRYKDRKNVYKFHVIKNSKFNISVTGNSDTYTDQDITLAVTASSLDEIDLHSEAYSFDDGSSWQKENSKTFNKNQVVKIRVRDVEGNTSATYRVKINKIDKTEPTVRLSVKGKKLVASVSPNKTPSGYKYAWYFNDQLIENATKVSYSAKKTGTYTVQVTTGVGKIAVSDPVKFSGGDTYTVSYNANGGSNAPSDQIKIKDEDLTLSSDAPIRDGYIFKGWALSKHGSVKYEAGSVYNANKSRTLYAVWKKTDKKDTYTINYDATGGSNAPSQQIKEKDKPLTISNSKPSKTDHEFMGWSTKNGGSVEYAPGATYDKNESVTLYAVWQKMKTITIKYIANGAQVDKNSISNSGTNVFTMPRIIRPGYEILGWSTASTASTATYKVGQKVTFNNSTVLYAITYKTITATFDKNMAKSISSTSANCKLYSIATLCSVTTPTISPRSGKKALGWSTDRNAKTAAFAQNTKVAISNNTTFYAITN